MGLHRYNTERIKKRGVYEEYGHYVMVSEREIARAMEPTMLIELARESLLRELERAFREENIVPDWTTLRFINRRSDAELDPLSRHEYVTAHVYGWHE